MKVTLSVLVCMLGLSLLLCSCSKKQETQAQLKTIADNAKSELTYMVCKRCGGTGRCQPCGGSGSAINSVCYVCDGSGRCSYCNGQGYY